MYARRLLAINKRTDITDDKKKIMMDNVINAADDSNFEPPVTGQNLQSSLALLGNKEEVKEQEEMLKNIQQLLDIFAKEERRALRRTFLHTPEHLLEEEPPVVLPSVVESFSPLRTGDWERLFPLKIL